MECVEEIEYTPSIESLPKVRASWSHDRDKQDYDLWLTARERLTYGLLWVFECQHGRWLLIGAPATVHGSWKKIWRQGVLKLPEEHKECNYKLYALIFRDLKTMLDIYDKYLDP
jgi:hypothetical protein